MEHKNGFSMLELMAVVGIISILAAFSVKSFYRWKLRAVQAQALTNLSVIHTVQQIYFSDNEMYMTNFSDLTSNGFELNAADKYSYTLQSRDGSKNTFLATATSKNKLASCAINPNDIWTMDEVKNLTNSLKGMEGCL